MSLSPSPAPVAIIDRRYPLAGEHRHLLAPAQTCTADRRVADMTVRAKYHV